MIVPSSDSAAAVTGHAGPCGPGLAAGVTLDLSLRYNLPESVPAGPGVLTPSSPPNLK
jgi:hypothetical protein